MEGEIALRGLIPREGSMLEQGTTLGRWKDARGSLLLEIEESK